MGYITVYKVWDNEDSSFAEFYGDENDIREFIMEHTDEIDGIDSEDDIEEWDDVLNALEDYGLEIEEIYNKWYDGVCD